LYEFAKKLTKDTNADGKVDEWGTILSGARTGIHDEVNTYYWASTTGAETFDNKLMPIFDNPDYVATLQMYQKILYPYYPYLGEALNTHTKTTPALPELAYLDDVTAVFEQQAMTGELLRRWRQKRALKLSERAAL
jgi:ABC-type glycerol-3-phosphate transport system substrate-binding protein